MNKENQKMNNLISNVRFIFLNVVVAFSLLIANQAMANNLRISNFDVSNTNVASNTITFTADVAWNNSWRSTVNHDAVWVFVKYSTDAGKTWHHASMAGSGVTPVGFKVVSGFEMIVPTDEKGFFLQRTDFGSGDVEAKKINFVWDYAQDGLSDDVAMAANTINKVFGMEMVYVPEGSFYAGDGSSVSDFRFKQGTSDDEPWYIRSEEAIQTTNGAVDGWYYQSTGGSGESIDGSIFIIPTSFPKGYKSFYQMKYELTEGQWVSFFNTLTPEEKNNHDITDLALGGKNSDEIVDRNTIAWNSAEPLLGASTLRPDRPVSYISWSDLMAYADWAGLRPMTELEFEKAARGTDIASVAGELAWGKTAYNDVGADEIIPNDDEDGSEIISDSSANLNGNTLSWTSGDGRVGGEAEGQKGPLRVGVFAGESTNRQTSGAGFYGAMELSGNLSEMVVTVGRNEGRKYLGTHGDGELSTLSGYEGYATNNDWPGIDPQDTARGVTGTTGSGLRGGDFASSAIKYFQISNRTLAAKDPDSEGFQQRFDSGFGVYQGGRLVRTAP